MLIFGISGDKINESRNGSLITKLPTLYRNYGFLVIPLFHLRCVPFYFFCHENENPNVKDNKCFVSLGLYSCCNEVATYGNERTGFDAEWMLNEIP